MKASPALPRADWTRKDLVGLRELGAEEIIHLLDAANAPLLRFFLTERYDTQGRPIPERFARYEDLKSRYGGRDGQETVTCENGMLQR